MDGFWLASYITLWAVVVALCVVSFSLLRLVGSMQERIGPAGAALIDAGPDVGERITTARKADKLLPLTEELASGMRALLVFVSPTCGSCTELLPSLGTFTQRIRADTRVVVINLDAEPYRIDLSDMISANGMKYLHDPELAQALGVDATPFALWLDETGVVKSKGVVNHIQHLESLSLAVDLGYASVQEFATAKLRATVATT